MPISLVGQQNVQYPLLLAELHFASGTVGYSSGKATTFNSISFQANRLKDITVQTGILDHANNNFGSTTLTICNLADDGSANFPIQGLDAAATLQDRLCILYLYSPDAADGIEIWRGYTGAPTYNGTDKTVQLPLTFLFDSLNIPVPAITLAEAGFATLDNSSVNSNNNKGDMVPLFYGAGRRPFRGVTYRSEVQGAYLYVDFLVSGTAPGLPFATTGGGGSFGQGDLWSATLFGQYAPEILQFRSDKTGDPPPHNYAHFPDLALHPNAAYAFAAYKINDDIKNSIDNVAADAVKCIMGNGRPLLDTGLPSENFPLIIRDILRDATYGLGMQLADFGDLSDAQAYTGTRYQARIALVASTALLDTIQAMLGECHCFMTWTAGKCQIRAKKNAGETATVVFATMDSGHTGRKIRGDAVQNCTELDFRQTFNQIKFSYHKLTWGPARPVIVSDPTAQAFAGTGYNKVSEEAIDGVGLFDDEQVKISMAIRLREYLSGNLYPTISVPMLDATDVFPGDLIQVWSPDIFNNASNNTFRILTKTYEFSESGFPACTMGLQVYKTAIYADNYTGLNVDLLRSLENVNTQGRPPDVTPVALTRIDVVTNDMQGQLENIKCDFTWPTYDPTTATNNGISQEDPRYACELWWHYQDESINKAAPGGKVMYPDATGTIQVDFYKDRVVEVFFCAVSRSGGRGPLGYIPDMHHDTSLNGALSATATSATVVDGTQLGSPTYVQIEKEIDKVSSIVGNVVNFVSASGARTPQFNTSAIAHPDATMINAAIYSYPSLTIALANPKFTYPVVTGVAAKQRQEDVKVTWNDISAYNTEDYHVYWSTDADAGTNPAKLGSNFPTWYSNDPEVPGTGVNLAHASSQQAYTISHEDIGPTGTTVYVRVAAKNGKRNYSATLSALVSSSATGVGAPAPSMAPTAPAAGLITQLPIIDLNNHSIQYKFGPIFANAADSSKTFADAGAQWLDFQFYPNGGDATKPLKLNYLIDNTAVTNITALFQFLAGDDWVWIRNANANGNGKFFSADNATEFVVGNYSFDPAILPSVTLTIQLENPQHSLAIISITQPSTGRPVYLRFLLLQVSVPVSAGGDGVLRNRDKLYIGDQLGWSQLGATTQHAFVVKHPAGATGITVTVLVDAHGGLSRTVTQTINSAGDATGDPGAAGVVQNFSATWEASHVTFKWNRPTSNASSIRNYNLWVTNTAGTSFMQILSDNTTRAGQLSVTQSKAGCLVQTQHHITTKIKLALLYSAFNPTFRVHITANNVVAGVITEGAELTVDVTVGVDFLNSTDAPNVLDVNTTMITPVQLLFNGDMLYQNSTTATQLGNWFNGLAAAGGSIITTSSTPFVWNQSNHSIDLAGSATGSFSQNLKRRISPNDYYSLSFLTSSSFSGSITVSFHLIDNATLVDDTVSVPTITIAYTGSGSYTCYGVVMQMAGTNNGDPHDLQVVVTANSVTGVVHFDRLMMVRGLSPTSYAPRPQFELNGLGTNENPDLATFSPGSAGTSDASNITKSAQGQWVGSGGGKQINIQ
jgi:hypothetical protein